MKMRLLKRVAACHEARVSYWLHNGHVTNNNEKMSKSLGNSFTIREITVRYHPLSLRHFLLSAHFRTPLNYSNFQLESASDAVYYVYNTLQECEDASV
ncbi:putative cysteine--tRNA ligase [Rosa chinensis]|uniref:Putative cysteine--tRNA ligase n=1 Tax=Rosa chinensis TaxID=74649 RepID=A0A2P6S9J2_ROSCH|nr:putative cysteine--tRNA ligase [Rosa chinensis]